MVEITRPQFNKRLAIDIFIILILLGVGYAYRMTIKKIVRQQYALIYPCSIPITYAVGTVDPQFGVSQKAFIADLAEATAIWEKALNKNLFDYATSTKDANVIVNLSYDARQETTNELGTIDSALQTSTAEFNALKAQYEQQLASFNQAKATIESDVAAYNAKKDSYERDVAASNARGGASKQKFAELEATRNELNSEQAHISQEQQSIQTQANTVNQTAAQLNVVIKEHNLNVQTYNTIGASTGDEFEEGVYVNSPKERTITIFQFSSQTKFIRVLAHEFGHALGLNHVDGSDSIMYKLNSDTNLEPSINDIIALKTLCKAH